jgi:hypothetical protein
MIKRLFSLSIILCLCGACKSTPYPTQQTLNRLNKICYDQMQEDILHRSDNRLSRWMQCKQKHIMPMEMMMHPFKKEEIKSMYTTLVSGAELVDQHKITLKELYDKWDSMQLQIGLRSCTMMFIDSDNSYKCMDAGVFNGS